MTPTGIMKLRSRGSVLGRVLMFEVVLMAGLVPTRGDRS